MEFYYTNHYSVKEAARQIDFLWRLRKRKLAFFKRSKTIIPPYAGASASVGIGRIAHPINALPFLRIAPIAILQHEWLQPVQPFSPAAHPFQ